MVKIVFFIVGFLALYALADYAGSHIPPAVWVVVLLSVVAYLIYVIAKIGRSYNG